MKEAECESSGEFKNLEESITILRLHIAEKDNTLLMQEE